MKLVGLPNLLHRKVSYSFEQTRFRLKGWVVYQIHPVDMLISKEQTIAGSHLKSSAFSYFILSLDLFVVYIFNRLMMKQGITANFFKIDYTFLLMKNLHHLSSHINGLPEIRSTAISIPEQQKWELRNEKWFWNEKWNEKLLWNSFIFEMRI